jgi:hypothetical protein
MPIDFPSSPTTGQVYTYQGKSWVYNGTGWDSPRALSEIGAVQTFANAAARTAAIPTPTEGIVSYLNDVDILSIYDGTGWGNSLSPMGGILQVVGSTFSTETTVSSGTFTDSGLSATITPKLASSKVLVLISQNILATASSSDRTIASIQTVRGTTVIASAGSNNMLVLVDNVANGIFQHSMYYSCSLLDSPATTSAVTYKTQLATVSATSVRGQANNSTASITLLEVSA